MKHNPDKPTNRIWKGTQTCTVCGAFRVTTQTRQNSDTAWSPWARAGSTIGYDSYGHEVVENGQPHCKGESH